MRDKPIPGRSSDSTEQSNLLVQGGLKLGCRPSREAYLDEILRGRVCVVRIKLPKFDTKLKIGKQVQLQVSPEAMRIQFPTQYEGYGGKYTKSAYLGFKSGSPESCQQLAQLVRRCWRSGTSKKKFWRSLYQQMLQRRLKRNWMMS